MSHDQSDLDPDSAIIHTNQKKVFDINDVPVNYKGTYHEPILDETCRIMTSIEEIHRPDTNCRVNKTTLARIV